MGLQASAWLRCCRRRCSRCCCCRRCPSPSPSPRQPEPRAAAPGGRSRGDDPNLSGFQRAGDGRGSRRGGRGGAGRRGHGEGRRRGQRHPAERPGHHLLPAAVSSPAWAGIVYPRSGVLGWDSLCLLFYALQHTCTSPGLTLLAPRSTDKTGKNNSQFRLKGTPVYWRSHINLCLLPGPKSRVSAPRSQGVTAKSEAQNKVLLQSLGSSSLSAEFSQCFCRVRTRADWRPGGQLIT